MSAVCVLTPLVVSSWPAISAAIMGAAASMGFSVQGSALNEDEEQTGKPGIETEIEECEIVSDEMKPRENVVIQKGDVTIEFGCDERGKCTVCVTGERHSDAELRKIGEDVAGRVVQQFTYNKLVTELKKRNYTICDEQVLKDESVRIRVRL